MKTIDQNDDEDININKNASDTNEENIIIKKRLMKHVGIIINKKTNYS